MRGENGVISTRKLLRNSPFGEWVIIEFNPTKTNESSLLKIIRERKCPRANIVTTNKGTITNFTPVSVAGGNVELIAKHSPPDIDIEKSKFPDRWKVVQFIKLDDGIQLIVQIPHKQKQGEQSLTITWQDGTSATTTVDIVREVR